MIGLGTALVGIALLACLLWWIGKLWDTRSRFVRAFLWLLVLTPVLAEIATEAGWYTAEMGRQPWVVYEVLKTSEAPSMVLDAAQVLRSIILFSVIYLLLGVLFISLLIRMVLEGPTVTPVATDLPEMWQPLSLKAGRQTEGEAP
jgi:cytochrome d ubiquinol oxidase subunit I